MLISLVFFVASNDKTNPKKLTEIVKIEEVKIQRDLMILTYDDIKSDSKQSFAPFSESIFFEIYS